MSHSEDESRAGKYLLLEVPNFNSAESDEQKMGSYLRLGAVKDPSIAGSPAAPRASGEDLASLVTSFIDDTRKRDGCPGFVPEAERQAETARLHTKGGWRDHSDGNRITTTRGDKVEVIKGNYKMVVLGRQSDKVEFDVSGGHIQENSITWAGGTSIEWVQNYDGTWRVTEETIKGDVLSTYQGDTKDWYYGNVKESTTGSEAPAKGRENPRITDRTWARSIASYTGSAALPVPIITDETWADKISSKTTAKTITDETSADSMKSETKVSGQITDETTAGDIVSTTSAGAIVDTTTAGAMVSTTTCAAIVDTTIGTTTSVILGDEAEIVAGNMTEITVGMQESLTIGLLLDITIALMLDVCIAGKVEVSIGAAMEYNAEAKFDVTPEHVKSRVEDIEVSMEKSAVSLIRSAAAAVHIFV